MFEVLSSHKKAIENSNILEKLNLIKSKYILISCHREENVDNEKNFKLLIDSLNSFSY